MYVCGDDRMVEIAAERTDGMANYFLMAGRTGTAGYEDLRTLCRSCYMQGVNDMLEVIRSGKVGEISQ
jgi:hypothetical protein